MSDNFQKKSSSIFVTILIGLIVISFAVTGYQGGKYSSDDVAKVGAHSINYKEYQASYNQLINFYSQFYGGGKALTSKQIKEFKLKERALSQLVDQKTLLNFSDQLGIVVSSAEVKNEIKNFAQGGKKLFMTNDTFDVDLYKSILAQNGMSPTDFEEGFKERLLMKKVQSLLETYPLSQPYLDDIKKFKEEKINTQIVYFSKESLKNKIEVSAAEIKDFIAQKDNGPKLMAAFERSKSQLTKPERVKARHILIRIEEGKEKEAKDKIDELAKKVTTSNFQKMANQNTMDPSGKTNGGNLDWFEKGRMVPEFEQVAFSQKVNTISAPVKTQFGYHLIYVENKEEAYNPTYEKHEMDMARELIQNTKTKEHQELMASVKAEAKTLLENGNMKGLDVLASKYGLNIIKDKEMNRYDGPEVPFKMTPEHLRQLFEFKDKSEILVFDDVLNEVLIKAQKVVAAPKVVKKGETPVNEDENLKKSMNTELTAKLSSSIVQSIKENLKVKVYGTFEQIQ